MRIAVVALLVAAAPIAAQTPAPADNEPRKPLNLRLDDAMRSQPVIQFGPPPEKKDAGLPTLGSDARKMESAPARLDSRTPYPRDTEWR